VTGSHARWNRSRTMPVLVASLGLVAALLTVLLPSPSYAEHPGAPRMTEVTVGADHVCALTETGAVWCWGDNRKGQLGAGLDTPQSDDPQPVVGIADATAISAGSDHTCAVRDGGVVSCWGANDSGQLGNAATEDSPVPVEAAGLERVTTLTAGRAHTCALAGTAPDQEAWCWGANGFGQLGLGSARHALFGFGVDPDAQTLGHDSVDGNDDGVVLVGGGFNRAWAFGPDGLMDQLWRLGQPPGSVQVGPVAATSDGAGWAAERRAGTPQVYRLLPDGSHRPPTDPRDPSMGCADATPCRVRGLATLPGDGVVVLVTRGGGTVAGWLVRLDASGAQVGAPVKVPGDNSRLTDVAVSPNETGTSRSVFVAAGERVLRFTTALAYQSEFSVRQLGEPCDVADDYEVEGVPLSDDIDEDESEWTFTHTRSDLVFSRMGSGPEGYVSLLLQYERIVSTRTTVAPTEPEPEAPTNTGANYTEVSRGLQPMCLVRADAFGPGSGTLDGYPGNPAEGTDLAEASDVTGMPDGGFVVADHRPNAEWPRESRLVRLDALGGEVASYGRVTFRSQPTLVRPVRTWSQNLSGGNRIPELTSLTAGLHHTCVSLRVPLLGTESVNHDLGCWGSDSAGQLGRDPVWSRSTYSLPPGVTDGQSSFPVTMDLPGLAEFEGVLSAGGDHTCHRRQSLVSCFGDGQDGQLGGDPAGQGWRVETPLVASQLEAGHRHTCAVADSRVSCWGADQSAQLGPTPNPLTAVTRVSAGRRTTCAVADGHVHCWGDGSRGQLPGGPTDPVRDPVEIVFPETESTVAPPGDLLGAFSVVFTTAVSGVTQDNVVLRALTSKTQVPADLSCRDALGATVDCASDQVREVLLQPRQPLLPGETYVVEVNPPGVSPVESGGDALDNTTDEVRGPTVVDDALLTGRAFWARQRDRRAAEKSYLQERTPGATATYPFRGKRLTLLTTKGPRFGRVRVQVDGQPGQRFDLYAKRMRHKVPLKVGVAGRGQHVATVTVLGTKRPRATDTYVAIDAVALKRRIERSPVLAATWGTTPSPGALGDSVSRSRTPRAGLDVPFVGTGVSWTSLTGPDQGRVRVLIDGVPQGSWDNSAPDPGSAAQTVDGLSDGLHTLRLIVQRSPGGGSEVSVDSIEVE
jgi:alpha-tubulin suppressor-like RCC1 family protein